MSTMCRLSVQRGSETIPSVVWSHRLKPRPFSLEIVLPWLSFVAVCVLLGGIFICVGPYHSEVTYNLISHAVFPPTPVVFGNQVDDRLMFFDFDNVVHKINDSRAYWGEKSQPMLFLHGHMGGATQIANVCAEINRIAAAKSRHRNPHVCFIAEFSQKASGLHWSGVDHQTKFAIKSINFIREFYMQQKLPVPKISLLGHSVGGCVARNIISHPETCLHIAQVTNIVAPTNGYIGFVTSTMMHYVNFPSPEVANPCQVDVIALNVGHRDRIVPPTSSYSSVYGLSSTAMRDVYESYSHVNILSSEPSVAAIAKMATHAPNASRMYSSLVSPFADLSPTTMLHSAVNTSAEVDVSASPLDLSALELNKWVRLVHVQAIFIWGKTPYVGRLRDYDPKSRAPCDQLEVSIRGRRVRPREMQHPQPVCVYLASEQAPMEHVMVRRLGTVAGHASTCLRSGGMWLFPQVLTSHPCMRLPPTSPWTPVDISSPQAPRTKALLLAYRFGTLFHVGVLGRDMVHRTWDAESDPQIVALRATVPPLAATATHGASFTLVLNLCVEGANTIVVQPNFLSLLGMTVATYMGCLVSFAVCYLMLRCNHAPWWTFVLSFVLLLLFHGSVCDLGQPVLPPPAILLFLIVLSVGIGHAVLMVASLCCNAKGRSKGDESILLACMACVAPHLAAPCCLGYSIACRMPPYLISLMIVTSVIHVPSLVFVLLLNDSFSPCIDAFTVAALGPVACALARPQIHEWHRRFDIVLGVCVPLCFNRIHLVGILSALALLHHAVPYKSRTCWIEPPIWCRDAIDDCSP